MGVTINTAKLPVTVVIAVKNEERNLPLCLERLSRFSKIVVIDSGSTDQTRAIAEKFGCEFIPFKWDGHYPKKRNWYLLNHHVDTPWVFFLDADEYVTDEFVNELERAIVKTQHAGFWVNYSNYFLGQELKHGVPQLKLPLFKVGAGLYERINEDAWSSLDMEVHEHPVLQGSVGELKSKINHNDFKGLHSYIAKHNEYSSWEARRYMKLRNAGATMGAAASGAADSAHGNGTSAQTENVSSTNSAIGDQHFTATQRRKYNNLTRWWLAPAYFLYTFVYKLGFLDGRAGYAFARMKAIYFWQIRLKIAELISKDRRLS
jgi:glycosyltransferase involved in cell wall biosynthesis